MEQTSEAIISYPKYKPNILTAAEASKNNPLWLTHYWPVDAELELQHIIELCQLGKAKPETKKHYSTILASLIANRHSLLTIPKKSMQHKKQGISEGMVNNLIKALVAANLMEVVWRQSAPHKIRTPKASVYRRTQLFLDLTSHLKN